MSKLITNPDEITLNERQEILQFIGNPPSIFLRFGITAISIAVISFFAMAYFIKYPDIVTARFMLTTENPPIRLLAKTSGRLTEILVKNNEVVKIGHILAVVENTADWKDVLKLEKILVGFNPLSKTLDNNSFQLGSLQNSFSSLSQNLKDYHVFLERNGVFQKIQHLQKQIASLRLLNENILKQKEIQAKEFELTIKELNRQTQLNSAGMLSDADVEKYNAQYLSQKRQIEANEAAYINHEMQIQQHEAQINDINQNKNERQTSKELTIWEDIHRLKAAIEEWKQHFLVIATANGRITFTKIWSSQQNINAGEEVMTQIPIAEASPIICKAILPIAKSGKVNLEQNVNLSLDAYPAQQYGILKGIVTNISLVPQKEEYQIDIKVFNSLTTSYGKKLPFRQEVQGTAQIITEDRRVITRIFERFKDIAKNQ